MTKGLLSSTFCTLRARGARVALGVEQRRIDFASKDAALGIDLINRQQHSIAEIGADTAPAPDSSRIAGMYTVDCARTGLVTPTPATITDARSPERTDGKFSFGRMRPVAIGLWQCGAPASGPGTTNEATLLSLAQGQ